MYLTIYVHTNIIAKAVVFATYYICSMQCSAYFRRNLFQQTCEGRDGVKN